MRAINYNLGRSSLDSSKSFWASFLTSSSSLFLKVFEEPPPNKFSTLDVIDYLSCSASRSLSMPKYCYELKKGYVSSMLPDIDLMKKMQKASHGERRIARSYSKDLFWSSLSVWRLWYSGASSARRPSHMRRTVLSGKIDSICTFNGLLASEDRTYRSGSLQTTDRLSCLLGSRSSVKRVAILAHSYSTSEKCFSKFACLNSSKY